MIRPIDEKFVESLMDEITRMPEGNYEALFILCKDCESKADFDTANCIRIHMRLLVAHIIPQLQRNLIYSFLKTPIIGLDTPGFMWA